MLIKSLFQKEVFDETVARVESISLESERQWGKMTVGQMLAHCQGPFTVPLATKPYARPLWARAVGWTFKKGMYNDKPWKQGMPTAPSLRITGDRDFAIEKTKLLQLMTRFYEMGPGNAGRYPHPIFGRYTPEQWGKMMWKHLDHHLRQFNT